MKQGWDFHRTNQTAARPKKKKRPGPKPSKPGKAKRIKKIKKRGRPKKKKSALKKKSEVERKKKAKKKLKLTNWGAPQNQEVLSDILKSYILRAEKKRGHQPVASVGSLLTAANLASLSTSYRAEGAKIPSLRSAFWGF